MVNFRLIEGPPINGFEPELGPTLQDLIFLPIMFNSPVFIMTPLEGSLGPEAGNCPP